MKKLTFKQYARFKRLEAGLTQQQCAAALGFKHKTSFYDLETEGRTFRWSLKGFIAFAGLLGVKPSVLMAEFEKANQNDQDNPTIETT